MNNGPIGTIFQWVNVVSYNGGFLAIGDASFFISSDGVSWSTPKLQGIEFEHVMYEETVGLFGNTAEGLYQATSVGRSFDNTPTYSSDYHMLCGRHRELEISGMPVTGCPFRSVAILFTQIMNTGIVEAAFGNGGCGVGVELILPTDDLFQFCWFLAVGVWVYADGLGYHSHLYVSDGPNATNWKATYTAEGSKLDPSVPVFGTVFFAGGEFWCVLATKHEVKLVTMWLLLQGVCRVRACSTHRKI